MGSITKSHSQILSFDRAPLGEVIESLEQNLDYVFNYDPALLAGFYYSGRIDTEDFKNEMSSILYDSPFGFEINQKTILVYREEPKSYRVCGTLKDADSGEPLIAANIAAVKKISGTQSDGLGFFDFELIADKNQKIEISYLGYKTISFTVQDLVRGDCPQYSLVLDDGLIGEEILITDYILDGIQEGNEFGGIQFDFDQLSKNHSNVEHDILKTAQLLPGINSIDDSATKLQIRGSSPDQNLILWEGTPIYNAGHIFGMISAINPFSVEQVKIYKGAHDPRYDNRVGGIIDISMTDSITNVFRGSAGSTLTEAHASFELPIVEDHLSLILSARHSIDGIYNSPPSQSYTDKVFQYSVIDDLELEVLEGTLDAKEMLNYHDLNAKVLYQASDRIGISIAAYNNDQKFKYLINEIGEDIQKTDDIGVNTTAINTSVDFKINDLWSSSFSFRNSSYNNEYIKEEIENGVSRIDFEQTNSIVDKSFIFSSRYHPMTRFKLNAGYEYNTKDVYLDLANNSIVLPEFGSESNEAAEFHNLFISGNYTSNTIVIDGGLRTSYYQERDQWVHSPRISLQYFISEKWKLKADGGIYHQFVSQLNDFDVLQITRENPLWVLNNDDAQLSQKANKFAAGFVFRKNGWLLDIDAYFNRTVGLSTISPVLRLLPGYNGFSRGSSTTRGIDFLLKKRWYGFNTWVNYTLARSENEFVEISDKAFFAPNDIRHNLSLVASYKIKEIQFSINANYHSGLPYSIPNVIFLDDIEQNQPPEFLYDLEYEETNNERLRKYKRFDFTVNYRPRFKSSKNLKAEFSFTIINFLNHNNIAAREYSLDFENGTPPELVFINKLLLDRTPLLLLRLYW